MSYVFSLLSFTLFCWSFLYACTYLTKIPIHTLFFTRILTVPSFFYPSLFLLLAKKFPDEKYKISKKFVFYHLIFIALFLTFIFSPAYISSAALVPQGIQFNIGIIYNLLGLYILSTMLYGCFILLKKYFYSNKEAKNKILLVGIGAFFSILMGAIFGILLPYAGISSYNFFAPAGTIFVIILWGLAILKHNLMDISVIIKKSTSYIIASLFIIPLFGLTAYYTHHNLALLIPSIILLGLLGSFFGKHGQEFLITRAKRKFIKGYYDADLVFKNISKKLAKENDRSKMFRTVAQVFDKQMQFEKIVTVIALRDKDQITQYLLLEEDFDTQKISLEKKYSLDDPVMQILTKQITPFYLKDTEKEMQKFFVGYGFPENTFCLPFASLDGLEGMIILGERSCGKVLKESELELFNTIISHVSALLYKYTSVEKVRKQFEANQKQLYETEVQLVRAEKIASLVRTTQECQHEIRTPINAIKLWLDGLSEHPSTEEIEEFRKVAVKHINRLLYVVDSSLSLGSNKEKKLTKLNINEVIEEATDLIPPSGYSLVKKLETVPDILGVKAELISVFLNCISNAKKAMEKSGGTLTIKSFFDENSQNVIVKITDTGAGIAPENLGRIWEPYFTTDKTYGHGLGLSIVHQIVQSYKGIVQVESVLKKGTTFTLKFPTAK